MKDEKQEKKDNPLLTSFLPFAAAAVAVAAFLLLLQGAKFLMALHPIIAIVVIVLTFYCLRKNNA